MYAWTNPHQQDKNVLCKNTCHVHAYRVILEVCGVFDAIKQFAGSGITIPIIGFGSNLAKGALEGVQKDGLFGAVTGGLSAVSAGLTTVIVCGFVFGLISRSRSKKI